jgi:hypothetical protein
MSTQGRLLYKEKDFILAYGSGGARSVAWSGDVFLASSPKAVHMTTWQETGNTGLCVYLSGLCPLPYKAPDSIKKPLL